MVIQIRKQEPQFNLLQKLTLFLLILVGMDFMNQYKIIAMAACVIFLVLKVRFVVNVDFLWLMLFAASFTLFSPAGDRVFTSLIAPFIFPLAYCVGFNFLPTDDQNLSEKNFRTAVITVSMGPFIHFILNFLYNLGKDIERNTYDFWSKDILSATGQATLALMMLVVSIVMLFTNVRGRTKVLSVLVVLAIFIYNLMLAGRTLFVMLLLIFAVSLLFLIAKGNKKSKKYKTLLIIVLITLALVVLYNVNLFGVQDAIESSNFYDRFFGRLATEDIEEDSRMDRKIFYIENFSRSFWGGINLRPICGYAHDIFLDSYDEAGIFALIAIIAFSISVVMRLIRCITSKTLKFETQQLILGMYVAILAQFMIEPIIQGMPWMFILFCFIHGMVTRLDQTSKNQMIN